MKKPGNRYTFWKAHTSDCSLYKILRVATQKAEPGNPQYICFLYTHSFSKAHISHIYILS